MNWKLYLAGTAWFFTLSLMAAFHLHNPFWVVYDMVFLTIFAYCTGVDRERSKKND